MSLNNKKLKMNLISFKIIFIFVIFYNNFLGNCDEATSKGKLIFAHVLFRHGDRTPIDPYPNDPWGNLSFWPVDWGQLTNLGKQQHYELGKWLRVRYKNLLAEEYSKNLVYIKSTDVDRTMMSALSNIAGLFPPYSDQEWNPYIHWQPIPVHTAPEELDYILAAKKSCLAYDYELKKYKQSEEFKKLNKKFKPLYEYLTKMSGRKIDSFTSVQNLYNNLYIEDINNKTLPEWTKKVYPGGDMQWIANRSFITKTITPTLARLKAGFLVKEMFDRFTNKTKSILVPNRSMWIYSAHDTTVANLLNTLGLFELHSPPYTACVMLELRIHNDTPFIQIFYKNSSDNPRAMTIPNCGDSCSLDKMYELYKDVLPGDFDTECKLSMLTMTYEEVDLGSGWGLLIVGFLLAFMALLIFAFLTLCQKRNYPNSRWYMRIDS